MAKPIKRTPTLRGEQAEKFLLAMLETQKRQINKVEKEFLRLILENVQQRKSKCLAKI